MASAVTSSSEGDSVKQQQSAMPPLFAGPLRDDLIARIEAAFEAGDQERSAVLLRDADSAFPGDRVFAGLHLRYLLVAQRKAHFDAAVEEAFDELKEDRFAASLSKFREALALSRGREALERKIYVASLSAAERQAANHWRFSEALVREVTEALGGTIIPAAILDGIERQKRDERIQVALDESGRAEHLEYLPHLRNRLAELASEYPGDEELESRLRVLDGFLAQRVVDDREKNLRRLTLFRKRVDASENPQTLLRFRELVAPFVDPYADDPDFQRVVGEAHELWLAYEKAVRLVEENRSHEALQICDAVLQQHPANLLFCTVEEKAKVQQWNVRLRDSTAQRARAFEEKAEYAEALQEWEALRGLDAHYPGLDSEILHCSALAHQAEEARLRQRSAADVKVLTPEIVDAEPELERKIPFRSLPISTAQPFRVRIVITSEAWNNLKTGLAATVALLLVVLMFATNVRR